MTFNGDAVTSEFLGVSDTFGRGKGSSGAFRADVTGLMHNNAGKYDVSISGLATKPGHRQDKVELVVLYRNDGMAGSTILASAMESEPPTFMGQRSQLIRTRRALRAYSEHLPTYTEHSIYAEHST